MSGERFVIFLVTHMDPSVKARKSVGRFTKPAVRLATHKRHMDFLKQMIIEVNIQKDFGLKTNEICFVK